MSQLAVARRALPAFTEGAPLGPPGVEVAGLVKRYVGHAALRDVNLRVEPGSSVAIVGPNGAGKTTLLGVVGRLRVATAGGVRIDGRPADEGRHVSRLGILTHETWLYDRLTVRENLRLHARLRGVADGRVQEVLAEAGLSEVADRQAGACSHGLRKRVSLARMMLHAPDVLVLDEPFSGLDADAQQQLGRLLDRSRGIRTVLFSTHEDAHAGAYSDRIVGLRNGRVWTDEANRRRLDGHAPSSPPVAGPAPVAGRSGLRGFLTAVWALLAKDLLIELRSRSISAAMAVFAGLVALTLMISFQPFATDPSAVSGVLWVLLAFAALHGLSRGFDEDFRDGALQGLRTTGCSPAAIYLAKVAGISLLLLAVGLVGSVIVAVAFDAAELMAHLPELSVVVGLAAIGLSAVGAILTVVARHSRMAETLLPIFMLPLSLPVLLAGVELLPSLLVTGTLDGSWLRILVLYNVGMLGAGTLLFPATLEE